MAMNNSIKYTIKNNRPSDSGPRNAFHLTRSTEAARVIFHPRKNPSWFNDLHPRPTVGVKYDVENEHIQAPPTDI